jgi:hypothetical protein
VAGDSIVYAGSKGNRLAPSAGTRSVNQVAVGSNRAKNGWLTSSGFRTAPWHGFWLYDNEKVLVETMSAALDLRQPQEIELYGNAFEELRAVASYGKSQTSRSDRRYLF